MIITSLNNPLIKGLSKLKEKKYRSKEQRFLIEGYHLVNEAYFHGRLEAVLILKDDKTQYDVLTYYVTEEIINYLALTKTPQMIIGVAKVIDNSFEIMDKTLVLENIQDPGNLGTIIRTAAALGVDCLVLSENSVDIYNDKVIRATQGAIFKIPIVIMPINEIILQLKNQQIPIFGSALSKGKAITLIKPLKQFALIIGNEAHGLSSDAFELTDTNIYIPMSNEVESLNVSVATAIILYQLIYR